MLKIQISLEYKNDFFSFNIRIRTVNTAGKKDTPKVSEVFTICNSEVLVSYLI